MSRSTDLWSTWSDQRWGAVMRFQHRSGGGIELPDYALTRERPTTARVWPMKNILVADDSETITTLLTTALESQGYQVTVASDGAEARDLGMEGSYDLAVLDQLMPGLLGLEVIDVWRAAGVETPVIMLTGVDDDRTAVDSLDRPGVDFMRKPFRVPELLARVRQQIKT
jgi:DNA-binding response OmpR family regulator